MGYFNYHAKIRNLIEENHLTSIEMVENWNGIKPAIVFYFDNNKPMPVREYRFCQYKEILERYSIKYNVKVE